MDVDIKNHKSIFDLMGHSLAIQRLSQQIEQVARTNLTVLIQGETGTGKELVACFIHQYSPRASRPLVAIDCGVLPESLFESESFGHVKGAFTGAYSKRVGYFELASGGTLFLDEIANLSLSTQRKLLRSVQERSIYPVGSARAVSVDVRLIAASSTMLTTQVEAGCFRSDLFYRLGEFIIYVDEPTKCREPMEALHAHSVRQSRYPDIVWDRRLCATVLLPVCSERTTVQAMDCINTSHQVSFPLA